MLSRIGRGALVGLPALGLLFVGHLARQDWVRALQEHTAGVLIACVALCVIVIIVFFIFFFLCCIVVLMWDFEIVGESKDTE